MTSDTVGVQFPIRDDLDTIELCERLGYESVWTAEGQGKTAFGKLERWATVTERIDLAAGIVNVFSRSPAMMAQSVATLDSHSDGRAILGLGVAHPGVVEEFHGIPFERPLPRMAEYITLVKRYLSGAPGGFEGEFYSPKRTTFWESFDPARSDVPIYNAAIGPENIRLTGECADGWLPNLFPMNQFGRAKEWLAKGASRADRSVDDVHIAMYLLTAASENRSAARRSAANHIAYYLRSIPGYYSRVAENAGFGDDIRRVTDAPSLKAGTDRLSDEFLDAVAIAGTPAEVREKIDELQTEGVDLPIVRGPVNATDALVEETLQACAPGS